MKHVNAVKRKALFAPLIVSASVQAASMVLKPGESSGDAVENEHPGAEQWLFVVAGSGRARVGNRTVRLRPGSLLLIEKREQHRITAGKELLVTVNFYAPPAYTPGGEVKRRVAGRK